MGVKYWSVKIEEGSLRAWMRGEHVLLKDLVVYIGHMCIRNSASARLSIFPSPFFLHCLFLLPLSLLLLPFSGRKGGAGETKLCLILGKKHIISTGAIIRGQKRMISLGANQRMSLCVSNTIT